ncbi:hypothetical protein F444_13488 [Phytophthora nicotianae P1976]|uniref:Uncharacterized protein n=1 Tax=Phytophthora nicotianae P1976 TaxID=1317066 RepID=A0A080ZTP1_PHYNI|nr:hypothetical protein F444_13488 [Phytophthora nicotianae P1976]
MLGNATTTQASLNLAQVFNTGNLSSTSTADSEFLDEIEALLDADRLSLDSLEGEGGIHDLLSSSDAPIEIVEYSCHDGSLDSSTNSGGSGRETASEQSELYAIGDRRKKYRYREKKERQDLTRLKRELTSKVQELFDAKMGRNTTARTDIALTKDFWPKLARQQREEREKAEAEQKRLVAAVQSQAAYIENLCAIQRDLPSWGTDHIGNDRWLRLKSSDTALFKTYSAETEECYARIDKVFAEWGMEFQPTSRPESGVQHTYCLNRILPPLTFEAACNFLWNDTGVPFRGNSKEIYQNVDEPENTAAVKFRVKKTLTCGSPVSILKRVVARRFFEEDRMVVVIKSFIEGEGIFSGMDMEKTCWSSIQRCANGSNGAILEFCSRQLPVPFLEGCSSDSTVKTFQVMLKDVTTDEELEFANSLKQFVLANSLEDIGQLFN